MKNKIRLTQRPGRRSILRLLLAVALLCQALAGSAVTAEPGFWTRHRAWGMAFLGGGLYMAKRGYDFKTDGDDIFKQYRRADTTAQADRLYDKANDQDIKSQISWGVAAALTVSAVRLLLVNPEPDTYPTGKKTEKEAHSPAPQTRIRLTPQLDTNCWGIQLERRFF